MDMEKPPTPESNAEEIERLNSELVSLGERMENMEADNLTPEQVSVLQEKLNVVFGVVMILAGKQVIDAGFEIWPDVEFLNYGSNVFSALMNNLDTFAKEVVSGLVGAAGLGGMLVGVKNLINGTQSFAKRMYERVKRVHQKNKTI